MEASYTSRDEGSDKVGVYATGFGCPPQRGYFFCAHVQRTPVHVQPCNCHRVRKFLVLETENGKTSRLRPWDRCGAKWLVEICRKSCLRRASTATHVQTIASTCQIPDYLNEKVRALFVRLRTKRGRWASQPRQGDCRTDVRVRCTTVGASNASFNSDQQNFVFMIIYRSRHEDTCNFARVQRTRHRGALLRSSGKNACRPAQQLISLSRKYYLCRFRHGWHHGAVVWRAGLASALSSRLHTGQTRTFGQRQSQSGACKDAQQR